MNGIVCPYFLRTLLLTSLLTSLIYTSTSNAQSQTTHEVPVNKNLHGAVESDSTSQKPITGSGAKDKTSLNAAAKQHQLRGALKATTPQRITPQNTSTIPQVKPTQGANKTLHSKTSKSKTPPDSPEKYASSGNKEVYLNIQDGTVSQNGGAKKGLQIGDNRVTVVGTARFEIKGPGEIRIKGRGCLSVIGIGVIEIDQTPVIKAFNFDAVATVDKMELDATDCGHVSADSPATINAAHCDTVVSTGDANITAKHCKTVNLVYANAYHKLKDGVVEASDCQEVIFSGGELDEDVWKSEPPRLIAKNCEVVRIYNGSARAIGCSSVEIFGGKLEVKDCRIVKNLKPDSNLIKDWHE